MVIQKRDMLEDQQRKLLDSARVNRVDVLCAVKVEEEPMSELNLKEQPNKIRLFSIRLYIVDDICICT